MLNQLTFPLSLCADLANPIQPNAGDIRRRNQAFVSNALSGRSTTKPARRGQKRSLGMWVVAGMAFLVVGGSE
jgi:hypothetical protein